MRRDGVDGRRADCEQHHLSIRSLLLSAFFQRPAVEGAQVQGGDDRSVNHRRGQRHPAASLASSLMEGEERNAAAGRDRPWHRLAPQHL